MTTQQKHIIELALDLLPLKKAANAAAGVMKSIGKAGKDAMKGIGLAAAGTGVAIWGLKQSLGDLEKGFTRVIQFQATSPYRKLATDLNVATNGIIDMTSALEISHRAMRSGVSNKLVQLMGKYTANLKLAGGETVNLIDLNRKLLKVAESGQVDEEMRRYLGGRAIQQLKQISKLEDKRIRQQEIYNFLVRDNNRLEVDNGNILNSKMTKFLGMIKAIRDESTGAFAVFSGFGKAAASILAPIGAGLTQFATGSPISGIIGTGIGALSSATVLAVATKVVQAFTGEATQGAKETQKAGQNIMGTINYIFENLGDGLEAFLGGLTGAEKVKLSNVTKARDEARKAAGIAKKDVKWTLEALYNVGSALGKFSDAFMKPFSGFFDSILKWGGDINTEEGRTKLEKIGTDLGTFFGESVKGIIDTVRGITKDDIERAKDAATMIKDMFVTIIDVLVYLNSIIGISYEEKKKRDRKAQAKIETKAGLEAISKSQIIPPMIRPYDPTESGIPSEPKSGPEKPKDLSFGTPFMTEKTGKEIVTTLHAVKETIKEGAKPPPWTL